MGGNVEDYYDRKAEAEARKRELELKKIWKDLDPNCLATLRVFCQYLENTASLPKEGWDRLKKLKKAFNIKTFRM